VITANQRAVDIIGCRVENLLDHRILDIIPTLRGTITWARYLEVSRRAGPNDSTFPCIAAATQCGFDAKAEPLGDGFILSITDITNLKRAYRELARQKVAPRHARQSLKERLPARGCGAACRAFEGLRALRHWGGRPGRKNRRSRPNKKTDLQVKQDIQIIDGITPTFDGH
jgi:hypothetical protein